MDMSDQDTMVEEGASAVVGTGATEAQKKKAVALPVLASLQVGTVGEGEASVAASTAVKRQAGSEVPEGESDAYAGKISVMLKVPASDEEALQLYGVNLQKLLALGVVQFTYKVKWPTQAWEGNEAPWLEAINELASAYREGRVGQRTSAKAPELSKAPDTLLFQELAKRKGISVEAAMALFA